MTLMRAGSVIALIASAPAYAQVATPAADSATAAAGRQVFEAAYFAQFAPSTALDIANRVPGFSIQETDAEVRGFGSAAGNVVINGQRPSSKSDPLTTILSRIPASQVLRVEVGPGDGFGAEYAGKAQVLNLVLGNRGGMSGTVTASVLRDYTGKVAPEGSISTLIRSGRSTFNVALTFDNDMTTEHGFDRVTAVPGGALLEYRVKENRINDPNGALSASWSFNDGAYRTANLNGRIFLDRFKLDQDNEVTPATGPVRDDQLAQRYDRDTYELGGDVTRPFAGGGIKLIGLATRRYRDNSDVSLNRVAGNVTGGYEQQLSDTLEETLARIVWTRPDLGGWSVETGAEGVINRLESKVDLFLLGAGGARTRIDLPVDDAVVLERRGELFLNAGRGIGKGLRLDLGAIFETSRITVSGDATSERALSFIKPKLVLDWRSGNWHVNWLAQRFVAQLQFEDFISSAELTNDRVNGGNANLLPQRGWETQLTVERKFLGDGLFKIDLGYQRVEKVQDRVPTPEGFDAPGNLGTGHVYIARSRIDAPLAKLGIKGARLSIYNSMVATSVRDPYTGRTREFSGYTGFVHETNFRQDLGKFAWGFSVFANSGSSFYRRNEVDANRMIPPYVTAFAEWRPSKATTVTVALDNATGTPGTRERTFYTPDRSALTPTAIEYRSRNKHIVPSLTVKHSLG